MDRLYRKKGGNTMKFNKAKRVNTVESYAAFACIMTTCSCSCGNSCTCVNPSVFQSNFTNKTNTKAQSSYNNNYYDASAVFLRN